MAIFVANLLLTHRIHDLMAASPSGYIGAFPRSADESSATPCPVCGYADRDGDGHTYAHETFMAGRKP